MINAWKRMPLSHRVILGIVFLYFVSAAAVHVISWAGHTAPLNIGLVALAMLSMLAISIWHSAVVKGIKPTIAFFAIAVAISWILEFIGHNRGWFFGYYHYTATLGPSIGGVPIIITVTWSFIIYTAFMLTDWLLGIGGETRGRSWWGRTLWSGLVAAATATLVCAWDLIVDPIATSGVWWTAAGKDPWWYWFYGGPYLKELPGKPGLGMTGVPVGNFVGWWLAPFFIVFIFGLFFQKRNRVNGSLINSLPLFVYFYIYIALILVALEMNWSFNGFNQVALIGTFTMLPVILVSAIKLAFEYT
ncbi:MAG: hypothetical protein A2Y75_09465 [Candidatus Solincola sediminis]|uniref:Carotenoid biosynthesis protein n=1 Tax=Candidatus Solincola sediminis TaxID=1797199 RepID=A0A1F2WFB7_9ACTN|nr:MAG: hypothetical protein A2Y75_09465 [Candidatus Solincola sediminis]